MAYFALLYTGRDYISRRAPYRPEHLALAAQAVAQGTLLLGGAWGEGDNGALLIFQAENRDAVEAFVHRDPYVQHGVVEHWEIRPWTVVTGTLFTPATTS